MMNAMGPDRRGVTWRAAVRDDGITRLVELVGDISEFSFLLQRLPVDPHFLGHDDDDAVIAVFFKAFRGANKHESSESVDGHRRPATLEIPKKHQKSTGF
ncbi:hypothetical protein EVAR_32867_1 [Eumeta japonica]|uniref:Uncharacterized protein n=1 Tax=Eumeta variegata TaxID=151549 RepID=A0A4C1VPI1_EUMVA|nr:hypothetical protein EVAR_32867_1 [Eumeta japonica]